MKDQDSLRQALEGLGPHFELVREIGRGATAVVYLLRDHELDRDVAAKIIRSSFLHDDEARARLQREALLVARLQHPNLVRLYGTRHLEDGSTVLLMEHVPGRNLKEVLREEGPLPPGRAVALLRDVASALAYAHRRQIVHRDVKPENIYLDDEVGTARLADFGVARPWDQDSSLTLPGESLGTPAYMSPEQVDGLPVDGRSDVYSLGLVGYEMLTGEHPWEGDNLFTLIYKQKNEAPPPLDEVCPAAPPRLRQILGRALAKDPAERWGSADALLEELTELERSGEGLGFSRNWVDGLFASVEHRGAARPPAPRRGTAPGDATRGRVAPEAEASGPGQQGEAAAGAGAAGAAGSLGAAAGSPSASGTPGSGDGGAVPAEAAAEPARTGADDLAGAARAAAAGSDRSGRSAGGRSRIVWILAAAVGANVVLLAVLLGGDWFGRGSTAGAPGFGSDAAQPPPGRDGLAGPAAPAEASEPGPTGPAGGTGVEGPVVLTPVDGESRAVPVGSAVPLEVRVTDAEGTPVAGREVTFQVEEGGGLLDPTSATTDSAGVARARFTLPAVAGAVRVVAALPGGGPGAQIGMDLVATPGVPSRATVVAGQGQSGPAGGMLPGDLSVRVLDEVGNPVPGAEVVMEPASGSGTVTPPRARTDASGMVAFSWRLGDGGGGQQVVGRLPEAPDLSVTFRATAVADEQPEEASAAPEPPPETASERTPEAAETPVAGGVPVPTVVRRTFAVGGTSVCRVGSQSVWCRGGGGVAGSRSFGARAVATGVSHACGLADDGMALCWGSNGNGQLGDGTRTDRADPVPVETEMRFGSVTAGLSHTCALDGAGRAWCWGRNISGQLGDGSREDRPTPRPTPGSVRLQRIVAGWNHTCGLAAGGGVVCWGLNDQGQLGDGSRVDRLAPATVPGLSGQQDLAAGSAHTCSMGSGVLRCWGGNDFGQLGDGSRRGRAGPVVVEGLPEAVSRVATGAVHTCALLTDASVWCWGQNTHGQLGDGSTTDRAAPVAVEGGHAFTTLYAGGGSTCGITREGEELCWGLNQAGQLGDGTRTNRSVPTPVGD